MDIILFISLKLVSFRRRVHISERTLQCLNGEFEVESAFGEKREETLRIAGLKTYFIKKVLIPVSLVENCVCIRFWATKMYCAKLMCSRRA